VVYLWLAAGPVAAGERWAWWLLAASPTVVVGILALPGS
jgi:hypothetical protein